MPGAGSEQAGLSPAGLDANVTSALAIVVLPIAISYDPNARGYPVDGNSNTIPLDPVDQEVLLCVTVPLGSLPSSPTTGIDLKRIRNATRQNLQDIITSVVQDSLQALIDNGSIQFLGAPLTPENGGRALFYVDYINLKLPGSLPRQLQVIR